MINNIIIIGSGPAGHTAAIYLSRANLNPLMIEGDFSTELYPGGLLTTTKLVENFPGFPNGIDGNELTESFKKQSIKFGTTIISEMVTKIEKHENNFRVHTNNNNTYMTKTIIIATGSIPNKLDVKGYNDFWHKGISTCATCDGALYKNKVVAIVGGGDTACEDALHLCKIAKTVYLIVRRDKLRASKIMCNRILNNNNIIIKWNEEIIEIKGNKRVEEIILKSNNKLNIDGIFIAIGHKPNSKFVSELIDTDEYGYIKTTSKLETNIPGIWAIGDVQDPYYKQAIISAGSGCIAALEVEKWLNTHFE
jgi:thioredoxin reductase (NADPH)